jgi:FkbM family methyltransferase
MGKVFAQRRIIMLLMFLVAGVLLASFRTQIAWRWRLVQLKTQQQPAFLSWNEVLNAMAPGSDGTGPASWVTGDVQVSRFAGQDGPCPALYSMPTLGSFWGRLTDDLILELLFKEQIFDQIYMNGKVAVKQGDVVLDVGGHLGTFTRAAINHGASRVVAFEPEPVNHACLEETFAAEIGQGRVTIIKAAALEAPGTAGFELLGHPDHGYASAQSAVIEGGKLQVRAVTIDQVVEELGLERVDFIKMDIEGGERRALEGARRTIARYGPRMALAAYHAHHPDHVGNDEQTIPQIVLRERPGYDWTIDAGIAYFFEGKDATRNRP